MIIRRPFRLANCRRATIHVALFAIATRAFADPTADELASMSLEELANVEVTSVSKSAEALRRAPASIYVITAEEIARSGATSIPEALRLAPNLEIRQTSSSAYVGAARGFAGNPDAQNFSNKLLILIDGRSVYTPLFSGIYYDAQDVLLEDIDRIEVISGPGATLWGANAMNGVINIITRRAGDTQGGFVSAGGGDREQKVSARYGGEAAGIDYRVYGKAFKREDMEHSNGVSAEDDWRKAQLGFRLDWTEGNHALTAQGDAYRALQNQPGSLDLVVEGANALTRWQRRGDHSNLQVQAYFDHTERAEPPGGAAFVVHTYDFELQQTWEIGSRHRLIVGGGERINRYDITDGVGLRFVPNNQSLDIANLFVHDTISLFDRFQLSLGLKLEEDPYSGWEVLPDARLSWAISDKAMLWASGARAIRSATPFDHDVVEEIPGVILLTGNSNFQPECVNAFELGYRGHPFSVLTLSASIFYNVYDDLRSIEFLAPPPPLALRLQWDNLIRGSTHGFELWAKWQATDWWRISPGLRLLRKNLEYKPGATGAVGITEAGNDPTTQASLVSSMDLPHAVTLDLFFRYVGALPEPALDTYTELNARVGWRATDQIELSITGSNLLDSQHRESPILSDPEIGRSVFAEARWRF